MPPLHVRHGPANQVAAILDPRHHRSSEDRLRQEQEDERQRRLLAFVLCFLPSLPLALAQNQPATSPFAGETAWIAYQTFRDGHEGVWLFHPDGTGDHRIATDVSGWQLLPDWSRDGRRVAFTTRGGETEPIYEYDLELIVGLAERLVAVVASVATSSRLRRPRPDRGLA
jgi:hypothetical protein